MMCIVSDAYGLQGRIVATPGNGDSLAALLLEAAGVLRDAFPECLIYMISRSPADPESVWVTEAWTDRAAHDASLADDRVRDVIRRARPLIAGMHESVELRPVGGKGLAL
jgi:quinol monooxygenase YgiN